MARFYANENFPLPVVRELRALGHDVVTSLDAGQANRRVTDEEVLAFAASQNRTLVSQNRRDFLRLHASGRVEHAGMVLCTADPDFVGQAKRIDRAVGSCEGRLAGVVIRVNRLGG